MMKPGFHFSDFEATKTFGEKDLKVIWEVVIEANLELLVPN